MDNTRQIAREYAELIDAGLDSDCEIAKKLALAFERYIVDENDEAAKEVFDSAYWESQCDYVSADLCDANETIARLEQEIEQLKAHTMTGQISE